MVDGYHIGQCNSRKTVLATLWRMDYSKAKSGRHPGQKILQQFRGEKNTWENKGLELEIWIP